MSHRSLLPVLFALLCPALALANPALEGYANYAALAERVKKLDESDVVAVSSLGKTTGGREILLLTLGRGEAAKKPAIAVVGGVDASHVLGSEVALRLAEKLVADQANEGVKKLLDEVTIYLIPRPDPDAVEKAFAAPFREVAGNLRKTDDDRDGKAGEDLPDDLNGDGWITQMRVADESGRWMPHPADARVLIEADPKKNERGQFRLYTEGRDDDGDSQFNEDAGDGVAFNRNFPHRFQHFQAGTGHDAVSEIESRAVADFLYDHNNVFAVLCFSNEDNLFHPWKPDGNRDKAKIRTTVLSADAPYLDYLAGKYRDLHGGKDAPESPWPAGTFSEWSYFQYGRWTYSARGWWLPKVAEKEGEKKSDEPRGASDLNALRWFAQENIAGFVDWQKVEHPDFPGKTVEVGGFKPFYRKNPPAKGIDELAGKHVSFLTLLASERSRAKISQTKVEPLGGGVFRVTVSVATTGYLPTMSEMGETTGVHQRLQVQLMTPEKTTYLKGPPRVKLGRIEPGGEREVIWLVRLPADKGEGKLRAWSPEVGEAEVGVKFE
jgi:hypothetical protein